MQESSAGEEIIPGVQHSFSEETGLSLDVVNVWMSTSMVAHIGDFDKLKPVRHYAEYFKEQDLMYQKAGKHGLFDAVMKRSNPKAVAAFDEIVDEYNADLPRIKLEQDKDAVQEYFRRAGELRDKLPDSEKGQ